MMMRWLFKLQLSYIRLRWDWKAAYRFKTKGKLDNVQLTEDLTEVDTMPFTCSFLIRNYSK